MRTRFLTASLVVLLAACNSSSDVTPPDTPPVTAPAGPISAAQLAQIDEVVINHFRLQHIPGLALVVTLNGKPVLQTGYGYANLEAKTGVTPDTAFQIGSVTKQFTASAIMLLLQDGKLKLDDPLSRYLPTSAPAWKDITLRHLLTHTAGLARDFPDTMLQELEGKPLPPIDTLVAMASAAPLSSPTGTTFEYSNVGYHLLGFVVEKVSGQHFAEFLKQRVFTPLGMSSAGMISAPAPSAPAPALGYEWNGTAQEAASSIAMVPGYMEGEGGLRMSANDLAKWDAALLNGTILTPASLAQMHTPATLKDGSTVPYGFGWGVSEINHHPYTQHNGGLPGFRTQFLRHSSDGLSVIVLTNQGEARPEPIAARIAAIIKPELDWVTVTDPHPQLGAVVRSVIDDAYAGRLVADSRFTPEFAAFLTPQVVAGLQQTLASLGPIERFGYIETLPVGGGAVQRYLLRTRAGQVLLHVEADGAGRVSSFGYSIE